MMQGPEALVALVFFGGVSAIGFTLARAFAKRIAGGAVSAKEIEALRDEIAQLSAEVEDLRGRVAPVDEMQNRLDFAERLLGQVRERGLLNAPKER